MKKLILLSLVCLSSTAFATIPTGNFSGYANSSSFNEFCSINNATVEFSASTQGGYDLNWEEHGFQTYGGGFCDSYFDATLTATADANVWDVSFYYNSDMIFGKAKLNGNTIDISANYNGINTASSRLHAIFIVNEANNTMEYTRVIESNFGPDRRASGLLNR